MARGIYWQKYINIARILRGMPFSSQFFVIQCFTCIYNMSGPFVIICHVVWRLWFLCLHTACDVGMITYSAVVYMFLFFSLNVNLNIEEKTLSMQYYHNSNIGVVCITFFSFNCLTITVLSMINCQKNPQTKYELNKKNIVNHCIW